jgi:AsmA protein
MSKALKYTLAGAGVLLVLLLAVPFLIPAGSYKARIEREAYERTGRHLTINGPVRVTLFPVLGVRADDVTFENVPGGQSRHMATMGDIKVGVRFLSLLSGKIEVQQIVLDAPAINLERDKSGAGNWHFQSLRPKTPGTGKPRALHFEGITINDGRVSYRSATGKVRMLEHANLTIGLTAVDHPVSVDGDLTYRGKRISLEAKLASLAPMTQPRDTDVSLTSDLLQGSFKGTVAENGDLNGAVKLDTTNIRAVAEWLGEFLPPDGGFKTLSLEGRIETSGTHYALPEETLRLDGMSIIGKMSVDLGGARPLIVGDVVVDRLDLNRYLEQRPRVAVGVPAPSAPPPPQAEGWSKKKVDLSLLHLFDANLTIDTGVLRVQGLHIGKTHLVATLADGLLNVALDPMALYGGIGKAALTVDVRGDVPQFQNALSFDNVSMRALLADTLGAQRIGGRGKLMLNVISEGDTADRVMRNLSGKGALNIASGQILGVDLGGVSRLIRTALDGAVTDPNASTPFSTMGGSFAIAKGVLATKDFHIESTAFRATGAGTVDIGNRTLDFNMKPRALLAPVGGVTVGVPFRAFGPWHHISYSADVTGTITGIVSDVFHSAVSLPGAIGDFFMGGEKPVKQKPQSKPKEKKSFFDNLFGH